MRTALPLWCPNSQRERNHSQRRTTTAKIERPCRWCFWNPLRERNHSQQRAAKPLFYNLQHSERPTDFVTGNQAARRLPLLRKWLPLLCVRSCDGCPCRFWNPQNERNQSQRRTERQDGCRCPDGCPWCCLDVGCSIDGNGLALVVSEPTEGKGSQPTKNQAAKMERPCLGGA